MGLKLNNYINDQNIKLDKVTIRKHLLNILPSELLKVDFTKLINNSEKSYLNQSKHFSSISLTINHKIRINEMTSDLRYEKDIKDFSKFDIDKGLGVAS
ncbi:transcription termination factor NusB [Staphylococcus delphini]|uniref:Transcription termination factor NusB n=1 Tax=Staphylococcus delphini TaxID=53344 RepID=A0AAQ0D7P1_9STAP|nr:transcription termination factor NusB [Staphylococcus delphini]QUM67262.1 transcription termination factor NusB [Staphylococcus delphini]QUM69706.1 transcription termination factor NusB [Staphylococcus delphini]HEC2173438.1 transcription termination factor NusB [Staphylococcus delphini]